jgi:hypothetical protein
MGGSYVVQDVVLIYMCGQVELDLVLMGALLPIQDDHAQIAPTMYFISPMNTRLQCHAMVKRILNSYPDT